MAKLWVVEFAVRSNSPMNVFPIDMLRYDRCSPASHDDVEEITVAESPLLELDKNATVSLVHYAHGDKKWQPTVRRWESFGWKVVRVHPAYSV